MYCKHCGKEIETQETVAPDHQKTTTKKTSPLWFKTLLSAVALVFFTILIMTFLTEDLTDTVEGQLKAIKQGNLAEAYYAFSSKKFQQATNLEAFKDFIKKYPAFSENKSIQFKERNVNNDLGTLDGVMTTNQDKKTPVEYKLVKESDQWKILSIRLEHTDKPSARNNNDQIGKTSPSDVGSLKFNQLVLGNTLSPLGLVKTPAHTFKTNSGDIYLNLYITEAVAGTPIRVNFEHLDSHSSLNPATTRTSSDGDAILLFVFSPPKNTWPKGSYRIEASAANEIKNSVEFTVE